MKIVIDGHGGDFAPASVLEGCSIAANCSSNLEIIVVGNKNELMQTAKTNNISTEKLTFVHCNHGFSSTQSPFNITKDNESSMAVCLKMLKNDEAQAMVSAGNTGALTIGAYYLVGRIKGVKRAALAPLIPNSTGKFLLLDAGANLHCNPLTILQFGIMGTIYYEEIFNIKNPTVGLINVGVEKNKGDDNLQKAFNLLSSCSLINFVGNKEARDVFSSGCNIFVTDGLCGNLILKSIEGTAKFFSSVLKHELKKSIKTKFAALLLKKQLLKFKTTYNYKSFGGAIFLGISKPIIKAHGNSNALTFAHAILHAQACAKFNLIDKISSNIIKLKNNLI